MHHAFMGLQQVAGMAPSISGCVGRECKVAEMLNSRAHQSRQLGSRGSSLSSLNVVDRRGGRRFEVREMKLREFKVSSGTGSKPPSL
jgi:hypothetical protein